VLCDNDESCKTILAAVNAHFGEPIPVKGQWEKWKWESSFEIAQYKPSKGDNPFGVVIVCSPELSAPGHCHPDD